MDQETKDSSNCGTDCQERLGSKCCKRSSCKSCCRGCCRGCCKDQKCCPGLLIALAALVGVGVLIQRLLSK